MKKTIYALIAGASLMVAGVASAETVVVQQVPQGTEVTVISGSQNEDFKKMIHKLDLTTEQKEKIRAVLEASEPKFHKGMEAAEKNAKALRELCGDKYDAAKIATLADAQGKLISSAIQLRFEVRHQVYEILTPKQREELKKFKEEEMKKMQQ